MPLPSTISFIERLVGPKELETTNTLQYTCPGPGQGRRITSILLIQDGNARAVTFYLVPAGQSVANGFKILNALPTRANDTFPVLELDIALRTGDTLWGSSSGAGTNIIISGRLNI